ncbi:MAG: coiled-coil domain-containing protein [Planctomycetota bacterium]|jgi:hypothetical protein
MDHHDDRESNPGLDRPDADASDAGTDSTGAERADVGHSSADQVLGMLANLERQLKQLGSVQQKHDEQLARLAEHSEGLEEIEPEVDEESAAPQEPSADLKWYQQPIGDRRSPAADRGGLDRREAECGPRDKQLEEERERLADPPQEHQPAEEESPQLEELQGQLELASAQVNDLVRQAERDQRELEAKTMELEKSSRQVGALQSRVSELEQAATEASHPADHQDAADAQVAALNEQIEQLRAELTERDAALADAGRQRNPGGQAPAATRPPGDDAAQGAMVQRQRQQIERLTEQLAAYKAGSIPDEILRRDARIAELEEQLEEAGGEGPRSRPVGRLIGGLSHAVRQARGRRSRQRDVAELEERIEELTAECERWKDAAQRATAEAQEAGQGLGEQDESGLLAGGRGTTESAARAAAASRRQAQEIREQWQQVKHTQKSLAATEQKMIRRWARPRAVVILGWLAGLAVVAAVASVVAANRFLPPVISASVDLEAKTRFGDPISDEGAAKWQTWHAGMLSDAGFHQTVAKRLADQRIEPYGDVEVLAQRLGDDLTFDVAKPGRLTLILAGTDRHEVTAILDTVATALARESSRQAGKRSDSAIAVVRGERTDGGRLRYATVGKVPIRDQRLIGFVVIFAVFAIVGLLLMTRIYRRLLNAKHVVDESDLQTDAII